MHPLFLLRTPYTVTTGTVLYTCSGESGRRCAFQNPTWHRSHLKHCNNSAFSKFRNGTPPSYGGGLKQRGFSQKGFSQEGAPSATMGRGLRHAGANAGGSTSAHPPSRCEPRAPSVGDALGWPQPGGTACWGIHRMGEGRVGQALTRVVTR